MDGRATGGDLHSHPHVLLRVIAADTGAIIGALIGVGASVIGGLLIVAFNIGGMRNEVRNLGDRMDKVEEAVNRRNGFGRIGNTRRQQNQQD